MAYYALFDPTETLSNMTGFTVGATARYGGNGTTWMPPELVASTPDTQLAAGRAMWDSDISDGLDTSEFFFGLDVSLSSGTLSFDVDNGSSSPLNYAGYLGDVSLGSVVIRAATLVPAEVEFSGLTITFWDGDYAGEALCLNEAAHIDTSTSQTGTGEQLLVVSPDSWKYERVTITGSLRFTAPYGVMPGYSDIFAQMLIMPIS